MAITNDAVARTIRTVFIRLDIELVSVIRY